MNGVPWSEEEDQILRDKYPRYGLCCIEHLPGRAKGSIAQRAHILGLLLDCNLSNSPLESRGGVGAKTMAARRQIEELREKRESE